MTRGGLCQLVAALVYVTQPAPAQTSSPVVARHIHPTLSPLSHVASSTLQYSEPWARFDDSDEFHMVIITPLYNVSFFKADGTIAGLVDVQTNTPLLDGSAFNLTWAFDGGGNSVFNNAQNNFSYVWFDSNASLLMHWSPLSGDVDHPTVEVTVDVPSSARWFDMSLRLVAAQAGGKNVYTDLWWPAVLAFNSSRVVSAFYPQLPGLLLNQSWFQSEGSGGVVMPYPGSGTFAEFTHLNMSTGNGSSPYASLSISTISGPDYAIPQMIGFLETGNDMWRYEHRALVNVSAGCDPSNGGWPAVPSSQGSQPCAFGLNGVVRTRFAIGGSVAEDMTLYGVSNGLLPADEFNSMRAGIDFQRAFTATDPPLVPYPGLGPLPPLTSKFADLSTLQQLAKAPLYKLDAREVGVNFTSYAAAVYPLLPVPGLIHYCAFEPVAFDHWYPDYLPPNVELGTGCELQAAFETAHAAGHLTMPYTNPTWWDPLAPTLANLPPPLTLADVTAQNSSHKSIYETYPDVPPATGVVTEIQHPFVQARWNELMCQLSGTFTGNCGRSVDNPLTAQPPLAAGSSCNESAVVLPSDLMFEDQIGARNAYPDFQPSLNGLSALGYESALLQHAANFSQQGLILGTEQGFDKLARYESGFYGNNLEVFPGYGRSQYPWGNSSGWTPHPLSSVLFGHTLLYQVHNLATSAFAARLNSTCWVLASGARLSIDAAQAPRWSADDAAWYRSVGIMQRLAISRWAGYAQLAYDDVSPSGEALAVGSGASLTTMVNASAPLFANSSAAYQIAVNWAYQDELTVELDLPWLIDSPAITSSFELPSTGCMAYGSDADVIAGWFTSYNDQPLPVDQTALGFHAIAEDRRCSWAPSADSGFILAGPWSVCVYHAAGQDTALSIYAPSSCSSAGQSLIVAAVASSGESIENVASSVNSAGLATFNATATAQGQPVDFFAVACVSHG